MRRALLLAHGWSYDSRFWDVLLAELPDHDPYRIEAGYGGAAPDWPLVPDGALAIGHSAGLATLLDRLPDRCAGLVAINGFTRFVADAGFPGVPDRLPRRMLTRLQTDPSGTVRQFRAGCGDDAVPDRPHLDQLDPDRLRSGLQALESGDVRDRFAALTLPVLALAACDDPIVRPAHASACFPAAALRWSETGGHLLPLTRPDWCARQIEAFAC